MLKSAAAFVNSRLHAVKAQTLILSRYFYSPFIGCNLQVLTMEILKPWGLFSYNFLFFISILNFINFSKFSVFISIGKLENMFKLNFFFFKL